MSISIKIVSNNEYEVTDKSKTVTTHLVTWSDEVHEILTKKRY